MEVSYQGMEFIEEESHIRFKFMKYYYFLVDKKEIAAIGSFKINKKYIDIDASEKTITNKFNRIIKKGFLELQTINGKKAVFINRESGLPLLGTNEFGLVDRNTNLIEVKAHSTCNLDCIFCSVDAGKSSKKIVEFVVEEKYLVDEFKKIAFIKKEPLEASINPQGEPLMYTKIVDLVRDLKAVKNVKTVSMNTNGLLLTEKLVDELVETGLDRLNISLNTINPVIANKLSGGVYNVNKVKKIIQYCEGKIDVLIAPLIVPGYNDEGIQDLLEYCKTLKITPRFGFQNFLSYQKGRNPVKAQSFDWFFDLLRENEQKSGLRLINTAEDYDIREDTKIPKPFHKGDIIKVRVICNGKYRNEYICVAQDRCITVIGNLKLGQEVKVKIVRDKHNIFKGVLI